MRKLVTGWCVALSFLLLAHGAHAKDADASSRQTQAEHEQTELRERIKVLQKEIESRESSRKEAADALKASESEISVSNRRLRELNTQLKQAQTELDSLQVQIRRQQTVMHTRRDELSEQLRKQYASGLSPWTALVPTCQPSGPQTRWRRSRSGGPTRTMRRGRRSGICWTTGWLTRCTSTA